MKYKIYIIILISLTLIIGGWFLIKSFGNDAKETTDLAKGALVINTDKSVYALGEEVYIQIISLDENGKALCDSNLELRVEVDNAPGSSSVIPVKTSPSCGANSLNPDYTAFFTSDKEGEYKLVLKDTDNGSTAESGFSVSQPTTHNSQLSITRWGASRVIPGGENRYPMKLIVESSEDFTGQVEDVVPLELNIVWYGAAKVAKVNKTQTISWNVSIKAGEEKELTYEYSVPEGKRESFQLGKSKLLVNEKVIYEEKNNWNIIPAI